MILIIKNRINYNTSAMGYTKKKMRKNLFVADADHWCDLFVLRKLFF